jgi:hypothetical protein
MDQFRLLNQQQQPFIQSGYGAMGKLNTLLGIGGRPRPQPMGNNNMGHQMISGPKLSVGGPTGGGMSARLRQLLALRSANGDTEASRIFRVK